MAAALDLMFDRTYFGLMTVESGDADALIIGTHSAGARLLGDVADIVGIKDGMDHFATMHILTTRRGTFYMADTAVNPVSDREALVDIIRQTDAAVRFFGKEPVMAMLSYSNFGSNLDDREPRTASEAVRTIHTDYPEIQIDGEMQLDYALDARLRDRTFPFNTIKGKEVNTLIFPNLSAANMTYKMMLAMGVGSMVGPIQIGLRKPVYFTNINSSERELADLAVMACLDAIHR